MYFRGWIGRVMPYLSNQLEGTEVWQLVDEDTLQADVRIHDPEALEELWYTRQVYGRMHQEPGQPLRGDFVSPGVDCRGKSVCG